MEDKELVEQFRRELVVVNNQIQQLVGMRSYITNKIKGLIEPDKGKKDALQEKGKDHTSQKERMVKETNSKERSKS